jgi:endonuclease/exonuclease/phosphatase family metal-dependent hydrolase
LKSLPVSLPGLRRLVVVALALSLASGCATVRNYLDPRAPVYSGGLAPGRVADETLRVVTFNLKWGRHVDRAADLFSRPGPLRDADLIVLQEVDQPGTERLAAALGLGYVYVPSAFHPAAGQDFGVALLSPWPLEASRKLLLPHQSRFRRMRRSAAVATLLSPLGPVRVYAVHLETVIGASGRARREQARVVMTDAERWDGPVIVAGDFNGRAGARELAEAGFAWPTRPVKNTLGPFDVDHVLARGLCPAGESAAAAADDETDASDHDPVWAVLAPCPRSPAEPCRAPVNAAAH